MEDINFNKGAVVWWMIVLGLTLISLMYLMVWGYQNSNMKAVIVALIFVLFIVIPITFEMFKFLVPGRSSFGGTALSYVIGLVVSSFIGVMSVTRPTESVFSLFTVQKQYLLSEISAQLPLFWSKFTDIWGASTGEELIFLITLPVILFGMLTFIANSSRLTFLKNAWVQIIIVMLIDAPLFYYFHVGNVGIITFMIAAIIFRCVILGIVWGDMKEDLVPYLLIGPAFAIGLHQGNNIMTTGGWSEFLSVMSTNPFGIVIVLFLIINIAFAFWFVMSNTRRIFR